jgi:PTS system cellobiose-specific IIC component
MLAFANGQPIPHIINNIFVPTFGMIGGTGSTISLLIAIFIFSRKSAKQVARLSISPGLFNINEPVIFGLPIVFNLPLMIPFVLLPAIGIYFAWLCTTLGWMSRCVVMIPWTTPPILSAWLATAGDWRAVVVQLAIIVFGVFFYLPFLKIAERVALKNSGIAELTEGKAMAAKYITIAREIKNALSASSTPPMNRCPTSLRWRRSSAPAG